MNTKTTTNATRKTANGLTLPDSFPLVHQRETLRNLLAQDKNDAIIDLVWHMENILTTSYSSEYDNTAALDRWSHAEASFADAMGKTWEAVIGEFEDANNGFEFDDADGYDEDCQGHGPEFYKAEANYEDRTQNIPAQPAKVEIPGIRKDAEENLLAYIERYPFRMVRKEVYSAAFLGACSSRRAGLNWHIWADRMNKAGMNPSVVAHIVLKAYHMPLSELIGFRR